MKLHLLALCVVLAAPLARAAVTTDTVTITVGQIQVSLPIVPEPPPPPPITVVRGAHVQLVVSGAPANAVFEWYKGSQQLPATGATLDLGAVTPAESGVYAARAHDAGSTVVTWLSESVPVFVTGPGQRLQNVSTRARIDANQRFFLTGFVVESGPAQTPVVVRAVGPALAAFGVADALAAPRLQVVDATGRVVAPYMPLEPVTPLPGQPAPISYAEGEAERAGAFPVVPGGKDVVQEYRLAPGTYTAEVSSADGGSGTALLEIYQLAE